MSLHRIDYRPAARPAEDRLGKVALLVLLILVGLVVVTQIGIRHGRDMEQRRHGLESQGWEP